MAKPNKSASGSHCTSVHFLISWDSPCLTCGEHPERDHGGEVEGRNAGTDPEGRPEKASFVDPDPQLLGSDRIQSQNRIRSDSKKKKDVFVLRIRGSVPVTNWSGSVADFWSCYFCQWSSRRQQKNYFFAFYFLKVHLHSFFRKS